MAKEAVCIECGEYKEIPVKGMCKICYNKKWRKKNKKAKAEYEKEYYKKNKERHRALGKKWKENNIERVREYESKTRHRRRAQIYGVESEEISQIEVFERDNWMCGICGERVDKNLKFPNVLSASLDHIVPLNKGGTHTYDNVQLAHFGCNSRKSDKVDFLFREKGGTGQWLNS